MMMDKHEFEKMNLRSEIERLRDALDRIARIYQRDSMQSNHVIAQAAYDMHCVAREALRTDQTQQEHP